MFEIRRFTQLKGQERFYAPTSTGPAFRTREDAESQLLRTRQLFRSTLRADDFVTIDFEILPPKSAEDEAAEQYALQMEKIVGGVVKPPELPMETQLDKDAASFAFAMVPKLPEELSK